jgi:o-succinylbenzoate synthase
MRIDRIDLYLFELPLRRPLFGPAGRFPTLQTVLVRMACGDAQGWGEASPGNAPLVYGEWAAGAFAVLRDWLAPAVCGQTIAEPERLEELLGAFRGNPFAAAALDGAWWDLRARRQGRPLHALLGGTRDAVELGATLDRMDSPEEFLDAVAKTFDDGFARLKLKFRPGWDVRMVEVVRREHPDRTLHIDVEGELDLGHFEMLCRLDDFLLAMIEQPLGRDDLVAHAMLQDAVRTPVCLDEGIASPAQADVAVDLKSCRYVNLKADRVGGLTAALKVHDICQNASVPCFAGATPQSSIGARFAAALGALPNCAGYPADWFPAADVLGRDLAEPLLPERGEDGVRRIKLWSEPGLGVEPDAEALESLCIARASLP